ncbi:MAG: hypothetical protein KY451_02220 [Actinobacteria bacterium]|nr:hypothetical protein [Actinomycetota bacterium]
MGDNFTIFMNALLEAEKAAAEATFDLQVDIRQTVPDGGVDALSLSSTGSLTIPTGDTVWQYKRSDLTQSKVKAELKKAKFAKKRLKAGASYRLVLGVPIGGKQLVARRLGLEEGLATLGVTYDVDLHKIIEGNELARWASTFPAISVLLQRLIHGAGPSAVDYDQWSSSSTHQAPWVTVSSRESTRLALIDALQDRAVKSVRLAAVTGVGATRVALEAVRGSGLERLVAYVLNSDELNTDYLASLSYGKRKAIIVADNASQSRHMRLLEALPVDSDIRLLTIGRADAFADLSGGPVLPVEALPEDELLQILESEDLLWPEARRFVAAFSFGNLSFARLIAQRVAHDDSLSAATVFSESLLQQLFESSLPVGADFLGAAALALFTRVGLRQEKAFEARIIAEGLGIDLALIQSAARTLRSAGFLTDRGRFSLVSPEPVAVYLAARAWEELGEQVTHSLLPLLKPDMAYALFGRLASLGTVGSSSIYVRDLFADSGPFASLSSLSAGTNAESLSQLAVAMPGEVSRRLSALITESSIEVLRDNRPVRRGLVNSLLKLAWRQEFFADSADSLMRLAVAENETYGNNATGVFVSLFGAVLPATSASPAQRLAYLGSRVASADVASLTILTDALGNSLQANEFVMVSGELQGGSVAARRGSTSTLEELHAYRAGILDILLALSSSSHNQVAERARTLILAATHGLLYDPDLLDAVVAQALAVGTEDLLNGLRREADELGRLFERVEDQDDPRIYGLDRLNMVLPSPNDEQALDLLLQTASWDAEETNLEQKLLDLITPSPSLRDDLLNLLRVAEVPAAYFAGRVLCRLDSGWFQAEDGLVAQDVAVRNIPAIVGALWFIHDTASADAFDHFLAQDVGASLPLDTQIQIMVRGPMSDAGLARLLDASLELRPGILTRLIFGWHGRLPIDSQVWLLNRWLVGITDQFDYSMVVDMVSMWLHKEAEAPPQLILPLDELVLMRRRFPSVGQEAWDWSRLVSKRLPELAPSVMDLLFDLMVSGEIYAFDGSQDGKTLRECVAAAPSAAWSRLALQLESPKRRAFVGLSLRGWALDAIPVSEILDWVGNSIERAQSVANLAPVGDKELHPLANHLLDRFGDDHGVQGSLYGTLTTGIFSGNESDRLLRFQEQVTSWLSSPDITAGATAWCRKMIEVFKRQRELALQREAERDL